MVRTWEQFLVEQQNATYKYSSTQVNLPEPLATKIMNWGKKIPNSELSFDTDGTGGREDEIHVTVLYGLHASEPDEVKEVLEKMNTFPITLGKTSVFTNSDKFDVVKISVESPGLIAANKKLSELPHTSKWDYVPHITVAYLKKGKGWQYGGKDVFLGKKFTAKEIVFSSRGSNKTAIELRS